MSEQHGEKSVKYFLKGNQILGKSKDVDLETV